MFHFIQHPIIFWICILRYWSIKHSSLALSFLDIIIQNQGFITTNVNLIFLFACRRLFQSNFSLQTSSFYSQHMVVFNNNNGFHTAFYFNKQNQHFQIASINLFIKTFKNLNESLVRLKYLIYQYNTTSVCLSLHSKLRSQRFYYFTVMRFYRILIFSSVLTLRKVSLYSLQTLSFVQ